jgi:hypothetical protein
VFVRTSENELVYQEIEQAGDKKVNSKDGK